MDRGVEKSRITFKRYTEYRFFDGAPLGAINANSSGTHAKTLVLPPLAKNIKLVKIISFQFQSDTVTFLGVNNQYCYCQLTIDDPRFLSVANQNSVGGLSNIYFPPNHSIDVSIDVVNNMTMTLSYFNTWSAQVSPNVQLLLCFEYDL